MERKELQIVEIGKYEPLKVLGRGSYGKVLELESRDSNLTTPKKLALKVLERSESFDHFHEKYKQNYINTRDIESKSIKREIEVSEIKHNNLLEFYGICPYESVVALAFDLCDGDIKSGLIEKGKRFSTGDIAYVGSEVCKGLDYLHTKDIIHRDIKADNVLFKMKSGQTLTHLEHLNILDVEIKLGDFGLARYLDVESRIMTNVGTSSHMPMEIGREGGKESEYDTKADIYSFGVFLCEMAMGRDIYKNTLTGLRGKDHNDCSKIRKELLELPWNEESLEDCVNECLSPDANQRPDASALLQRSLFHTEQMSNNTYPLRKEFPIGYFEKARTINKTPSHLIIEFRKIDDYSGFPDKVILKSAIKGTSQEQEVIALNVLQHQNIVAFYGTCMFQNRPALALEQCHGTAWELKENENIIKMEYLPQIARDILQGLAHIHEKGMVHCRIKPSRIMYNSTQDEDQVAKQKRRGILLDVSQMRFKIGGVASCVFYKEREGGNKRELTKSRTATQVNCYDAPEMVDLEKASPASDIFSFGITLCALLKDRPEEGMGIDLEESHYISKELLVILANDVDFQDLIMSCLQTDPNARPSAKELLNHPFVQRGHKSKSPDNETLDKSEIFEKFLSDAMSNFDMRGLKPQAYITAFSISSNLLLFVGEANGRIQVFDLKTNKVIQSLETGKTMPVTCLTTSSNFVAGCYGRMVGIWRQDRNKDKRPVKELFHSSYVLDASMNNTFLVSQTSYSIQVYKTTNWTEVSRPIELANIDLSKMYLHGKSLFVTEGRNMIKFDLSLNEWREAKRTIALQSSQDQVAYLTCHRSKLWVVSRKPPFRVESITLDRMRLDGTNSICLDTKSTAEDLKNVPPEIMEFLTNPYLRKGQCFSCGSQKLIRIRKSDLKTIEVVEKDTICIEYNELQDRI